MTAPRRFEPRRTGALAALACAALLLGCSDRSADPQAGNPALRLPALHAEPDPGAGGRIVDAEGREVLLRGVNVNALAEYWQGTTYPTTFPFEEGDAERIAAIGWNAVRLLLSWSRVEPEPGRYDDAYLREVEAVVEQLARQGVYSILDLHQDAWGAALAAPVGQPCPAGSAPAFGWDGAPAWATLDGGATRCAPAEIRELSPAVRAAWGAFWRDDAGPGGIGIRTRYARMVGALAERFSTARGVAGYDVMNEPNAFGAAEEQALSALYADALREIRAGEARAGAEAHLVLFEPSAVWSNTGRGAPPDFARDRDVVYAPHLYSGGFSNGPITADAFAIARAEAATFGGAPVLSGEWGSDPSRAANPADGYFLRHQELQDEFRFGATLWTWRESCGDPHKAGDYRAGRIPTVWGEFDVDCRTNEVVGVRQALVDQLTRAWVRAAPGHLATTRDDAASGALSAAGEAPAGETLVAFYPAAARGAPRLETDGLRDVRTAPAAGGGLYLLGETTGGAWSLAATP